MVDSIQLVRAGVVGVVLGIGGIGLLLWELSEDAPSFWGIVRSLLISMAGFGLIAALIWRNMKSGR